MSARITKLGPFGGCDENAYGNPACAVSCTGFSVDDGGALVKGPGFEEFIVSDTSITGMWSGVLGTDRILAYIAGTHLFIYNFDTHANVDAGMTGGGTVTMFGFGGCLYILTPANYFKYDGTTLASVEGYIPLIAVSTTPAGAGTAYESVNMLTSKRRQQFSGDGTSTVYRLSETGINSVVSVTVGGEVIPPNYYTVDDVSGIVSFASAPASGLNNVEITYAMPSSNRSVVLGCTCAMLFGSNADVRVFLWGRSAEPCCRYHSELADGVPSAEYFPVTAYTFIGNTAITDIIQLYDKQLIFTVNSAYYSYCEMETSLTGQTYASFPVYPLNPVKGSFIYGNGCTMNGMPVTLCADGLNYWQSSDVEDEKNAVCFSAAVRSLIKPYTTTGYSTALVYNDISSGQLFFAIPHKMYVYNYRRNCWFTLEGITAMTMCNCFGTLFIAANDKTIYRLSESVNDFDAVYETHFGAFGSAGLKNIKDVVLTLKAGTATAGSVTMTWNNGARQQSRTEAFTIPAAMAGEVVKVRLPMYIPLAGGASLTFACPSGYDMRLLSCEITTTDKGELPSGI